MAIADYDPIAQPLAVLSARLAYHAAVPGRLLYGLRGSPLNDERQAGVRDLPYVQLQDFTMEESNFAGAYDPATSVQGATNREMTIQLLYVVRSRLEYGFIRSDPSTQDQTKKGLIEWVARVMDAMEIRADGSGRIDPMLDGTCYRPITFEVGGAEPNKLSWASVVMVTITPKFFCRGNRTG